MKMMNVFSYTYLVTPLDMDSNYRLTQNSALCYMQDCFARFVSQFHMGAFDIRKQNKLWMISEIHVRFVPDMVPFWTDSVTCSLWFSRISGAKAYSDYRMTNMQGNLFAEGTCCWAVIDANERRVVRLDEMLSPIPVRNELALGSSHRPEMPKPNAMVEEREHRVSATEIDQNEHLNNRAYIQIALSVFRRDFLQNRAIEEMNIRFLKEAFFGDRLLVRIFDCESDPNAFYSDILHEDGSLCCRIYSRWRPFEHVDPADYYDACRPDLRKE